MASVYGTSDRRQHAIRRLAHIATATFALLLLAGAPAAHAAGTHDSMHRLPGVRLASGVTVFPLRGLQVDAVVGAHLTFASGRRVRLRLRRLRAGTRAGTVRLHLPRHTGRVVLTVRVARLAAAPRNLAANSGAGRRRATTPADATTGRPAASSEPAVPLVAITASPLTAAPDPAKPATPADPVPDPAPDPTPDPAPLPVSSEQPGPTPGPVTCDRFAAVGGNDTAAGTSTAPFATAQRLFDALTPGQTGCLRGGVYHQYELRARHAGTPAAPIVLASAPGERATVIVDTDVYLPKGITDVTVRNLDITNNPASGITQAVMIQDFSDRSVWENDDLDGNSISHCMELGWAGNATAHDTMIRRNRFHDCGNPANGNQEHAVYISQTVGATITENVFWNTAAYAIHLYPSADRTTVTHNVIVGSGYAGVIFASDQSPGTGRVSDDNEVAYNVITGGRRYGLEVFWGASGQGTGNRAHDNCIAGNAAGAMAPMPGIALSGNVTRAVGYVDAAAHDYRLAAGDACLGVVGFDTAALLQ